MPDPVTGIGAAVSIGGSVLKGKAASKAGKLQAAGGYLHGQNQRKYPEIQSVSS
jgi:hypothetical protein